MNLTRGSALLVISDAAAQIAVQSEFKQRSRDRCPLPTLHFDEATQRVGVLFKMGLGGWEHSRNTCCARLETNGAPSEAMEIARPTSFPSSR
jgi:hypothetical protein